MRKKDHGSKLLSSSYPPHWLLPSPVSLPKLSRAITKRSSRATDWSLRVPVSGKIRAVPARIGVVFRRLRFRFTRVGAAIRWVRVAIAGTRFDLTRIQVKFTRIRVSSASERVWLAWARIRVTSTKFRAAFARISSAMG